MGAILHLVVLLPFVLALLVPWLARILGSRVGWAVLPLPVFSAIYLLSVLPAVGNGETITGVWSWAPSYGLELAFVLDGFGLLFALLIAGIGSLVVFYSIYYLDPNEALGRFYTYILLFMGAMFGVVLSDNLLALYMFWEITSISSFLLIGFWHTKLESRQGALKSMLTTVMGGLSLLAGFLLLGSVGGTFSLRALVDQASDIIAHPYYPAIVILVLIGAFTKSAQAPFHLWLPGAMAAPTPISAYLHSATMVKAGIFLTALMSTILGGTALWFYTVAAVGIATMVLGSYLAVQQRDLKSLLAFSTVSQLGLIVIMFAFGTEEAMSAGIFHILNHGIFKGMLFMLVGIIDHQTGTRDIGILSGLRSKMPLTAALMFIGAFSMAGVPLLNGFVSKEMILAAMLNPPVAANLFTQALPVLAVLGSAFTVVYCLILTLKIFLGPLGKDTPVEPSEAPLGLLLPPLILGGFVIMLGVVPQIAEHYLVGAGTTALLGEPSSVHLALWHGLNPALFMSVAAILLGVLVYYRLDGIMPTLRRLSSVRLNVNAIYDKLLDIAENGSKRFTRRMMTGYLRDYFVFILGFTVALTVYAAIRSGLGEIDFGAVQLTPISWSELVTVLVMIAAAIAAVFLRQRVAIALAVGTVGFMVSVLWFLWEAPDLALTQMIVETVSIVPLFLAFSYMARLKNYHFKKSVVRVNALVAIGLGVVAGGFTFVAHSNQLFSSIGHYFVENSYTAAGGLNIVNVLLVVFRGFDTLFETTVFAVVALAIYTLVRSRRNDIGVVKAESPLMINPVIVPAISRVLFYLVHVFALYLFFRGHNHPGGGFAAGVMSASAIFIWALAFERTAAIKLVPFKPRYIIGTGLLVIIAVGLGGVLLGYPFLTHTFGHVELPFVGEVELATAVLFDLGVWLIVFGAIYSMVASMSDGVALEQEHVKAYAPPASDPLGR